MNVTIPGSWYLKVVEVHGVKWVTEKFKVAITHYQILISGHNRVIETKSFRVLINIRANPNCPNLLGTFHPNPALTGPPFGPPPSSVRSSLVQWPLSLTVPTSTPRSTCSWSGLSRCRVCKTFFCQNKANLRRKWPARAGGSQARQAWENKQLRRSLWTRGGGPAWDAVGIDWQVKSGTGSTETRNRQQLSQFEKNS